jgi:RND family efflux transporter MFP subunit
MQHLERDARPRISRSRALAATAFAFVIVAGLASWGIASRTTHINALTRETADNAIPTVAVVKPKAGAPQVEIVLPGNVQAYLDAPIYARTAGYLRRRHVELGARVKAGDLLAEIDAPELEQQLQQSRADLATAEANARLAQITADRYGDLRKTDSVSQQEADQQTSGYQQARANLAAAEANVRRLEQLESFKNVYAPFSGVLTRRTVDPGALINAGAGAAGKELFDVARVDPLRVYVSVPQAYAPAMKVGVKAVITLQEFPGQKFLGTIARTADAIDPSTRTLLTEVDVPNKAGELLPGSFGQVHFATGTSVPRLTIPVNTMIFRAEGPRVAVVGQDGKVGFHPINIGRDFGATLEILGGIDKDDQIIINPSDSLEEGQQVHVAKPQQGG